MIGNSRDREAIAALRESMTILSAQVAATSEEVAAMSARHLIEAEHHATHSTTSAALGDRVSKLETALTESIANLERMLTVSKLETAITENIGNLERMLAAQAEMSRHQAERISVLSQAQETADTQIRMCSASLARLDGQVASDMAEFRETTTAIASKLLRTAR